MSQRSIVEFNHDQSHAIERQSEHFVVLLKRALASGSDDAWDDLLPFGVNRIVQAHHSTDRKVVCKIVGQDVEYPVG